MTFTLSINSNNLLSSNNAMMGHRGVGVRPSLYLVLLFITVKFSHIDGLHLGLCFPADGHSIGVRNFCDRCDRPSRSGVGVLWTESPGSVFAGIKDFELTDDIINLNVTSIAIDGVPLDGWYHIIVTMPVAQNIYSFTLQVEDQDTTNQAVGELTTDLLSACEGGNLANVPTAAQLIPCHATPKVGAQVSNALVYSREASVTDGIIRSSTPPTEFHVNWKVPNNYMCSLQSRFVIRLNILTLPSSMNLNNCEDDGSQCPLPTQHFYHLLTIILPSLGVTRKFNYPAPIPPFYDATKVNCHIPIPVLDGPGRDTPFPHLDNYTINSGVNEPLTKCIQGAGIVPPGETFNPGLPKQPPRSLYIGRCTEVKGRDGEASPETGIPCDTDYDRDDKPYTDTFISLMNYTEGVRYDLCGCDKPPSPPTDGGSINPVLTVRPVPPPPPDYPNSEIPTVSPSNVTLAPSSVGPRNNSTPPPIENSNLTRETPLQKIQRKVNMSRFIHGLFSSLAFTLLVPLSNFTARYMKESFYKDRVIIDWWYKVHLGATAGIFVCLTVGQFALISGNYWNVLLEPVKDPKAELHGWIGRSVIGLYCFIAITGGLRPYSPTSNFCLKLTIYFHGIIGFGFYYLGVSAMMPYLITNFREMLVFLSWISLDGVYHILMTGLEVRWNRKLNLNRSWFPVMELIFDHRDCPGRGIRNRLFKLYILLSLLATGVTCYYTREVVFSEPSAMNRTLIKSAKRVMTPHL